MQVKKGPIGDDFLHHNPCHKESCVNVCPFWGQTAPQKSLAYDLALSGIRPLDPVHGGGTNSFLFGPQTTNS